MNVEVKNNSLRSGNQLFKDILIFGGGIAFAKAIQFFLMPLYTTYLSTDEYARGELINNISDLLLPLATLCLYEAGFRYVADNSFKIENVYSVVIRLLNITFAFIALIFVAIHFLTNCNYCFLLYIDLLGYSYLTILSYLMKGRGFSKTFVVGGIINACLLYVLSYVFIVCFGMKENGYLLAISLAYFPACIFLLLMHHSYRYISKNYYSRECCKALLSYGVPLVVYNIGYWLVTISGRYVLLYLKGESEAGIYVACMKTSTIMNLAFYAVHASFQLNGIRQFSNENREKYYSNICNFFISVFGILAALLILLTPILGKLLLKKEFNQGTYYIPFIVISATIYALSSLYGTMYSIYKKPSRLVPCIFVGAIINIGVALILGRYIGIWGVVVASIISYLFQFLFKVIDQRKFVTLGINWKVLVMNFVLLIAMAFCSFGSRVLVQLMMIIDILGNAYYMVNEVRRIDDGNW